MRIIEIAVPPRDCLVRRETLERILPRWAKLETFEQLDELLVTVGA